MVNKNKELAVNTAILTIGRICTQFMSFFLMPLYTAALSTEEYGVVDLVGTYTSLLLPVALLQIDQALIEISMRSHSAVTMILQVMVNKNIIISKKERGYHLCPEQKVAKISPKW